MAKTITGNVCTLTTAAAINSVIRFEYASNPGLHEGQLVSSADDVVADIGLDGSFSAVLATGSYKVTIDDVAAATWYITVEEGVSEELDIVDILVPSPGVAPTPSAVVPVASTTTYGKVKITKNGSNIRVAVGLYIVTNVTALKAIVSDDSNQMAVLYARDAGEPSLVYWDGTSAAADDTSGFTVIKPTDNPTTGRWKPFTL